MKIASGALGLLAGACGLIAQSQSIAASAGPEALERPITLAIKYVEYQKPDGGPPALSRAQADEVVRAINAIYSRCEIRFELEQYVVVSPARARLKYSLNGFAELDRIRSRFDDGRHLLVVNTGPWDHQAMGAPNAWTSMPGERGPKGAIIEGPVASFAPIVAHELGHYLSLEHAGPRDNLMSAIIAPRSVLLSPAQCTALRRSAQTQLAIREPATGGVSVAAQAAPTPAEKGVD